MHELHVASELYNAKIISVTETHLTREISDSEVKLNNFKIFRKDRESGKICGGSCIFVHNTIEAEYIKDFVAPDSVGISLKLNNHWLNIVCVYRSQNLSFAERTNLYNSLKEIKIKQNEELQVYGDFNLPNVNWDTSTVNCPINTVNPFFTIQRDFLEVLTSKGLTPLIEDGTVTRRRMVNGILQESLLDQVLVSNPNTIINTETLSPLGKSDHIPILITLKIKNDINYVKTEKEVWSKFSKQNISDLGSNIHWDYSSEELSSNQMWDELHHKLLEIATKCPKTKIKCSKNGDIITKLPWDCSSLKRDRTQKDAAWRKFDSDATSVNLNIALQKQGQYDKKQHKKVLEHENKIVKHMKTNPKSFYKYLNSKLKVKESVSVLKDQNNKFTESPRDTANLLADFFSSTFVKEPYGPLEEEFYKNCENAISDLEITTAIVKKLLQKVNPSKSMGPDNINPKLLLSLAENDNFISAVTILFQKCFETGSIPLHWKTANVIALHKKGSKMDASNYRPISLTCIICKIYEQIVRTHIFQHVLSAISIKQHGFLPGRSCLSNLLESMDIINNMIAEGECVDIFYLDFQKAFDTVPHYRLLTKLSSFGITGKILATIRDFLFGRTFTVMVGDSTSERYEVTSGIPQGSVLGPLLFLLYINDLPENIKNDVALFADDLKMIGKSRLKQINQKDIDSLVEWQSKWLLKFNTKDNKCKVVHVGKGNPCNQYYMGDVLLPSVESEKDLGVIVSKNWKWNDHITSCINKANSMIAWVTRSVITRKLETMLNIYKSMIRPHIEYCVQLWSPLPRHGNWELILAIEDIQRKFTRLIDNIGLLPYSARLEKLGLTTLLERRARGDLIETFKIVNGISNYGKHLFKFSRSGNKLISRPGDQHRAKYDFFSRRVINYWNKLPSYVKFSKNIDSFKNNLTKFKRNNFFSNGNFWELSKEIFTRIPETHRNNYVAFVNNNPDFARRRNINTQVTMN
jgi:hypothetical protein